MVLLFNNSPFAPITLDIAPDATRSRFIFMLALKVSPKAPKRRMRSLPWLFGPFCCNSGYVMSDSTIARKIVNEKRRLFQLIYGQNIREHRVVRRVHHVLRKDLYKIFPSSNFTNKFFKIYQMKISLYSRLKNHPPSPKYDSLVSSNTDERS